MTDHILRPTTLVRRHRYILSSLALLLLAGLIVVAVLSYRTALSGSVARSSNRLALHTNALINSLEKYRLLTPLLARQPDILAVYSNNRDDEDIATALAALTRIGGMAAAADIELSFVNGERISLLSYAGIGDRRERKAPLDRKDVVEALNGSLGRTMIINEEGRFYVFSSAARIDGAIAGVVSVHVDLSEAQQNWALSEAPIVATANGRVVFTNREAWLDAALYSDELPRTVSNASTELEVTRSLFGPLLVEASRAADEMSVDGDFVAVETENLLLGWTFLAMEPLRNSVFVASVACLTATLFAGLLWGALWVVFNRQRVQLEQRRKDLAASLWLERRVRDRTKELRQTQEGLVHSAKLAAIGQMSTVLSHEYNQPLSAIRSYADNAKLLFDAGKVEQGQDNLDRIGKLVDRLASLSKTLKTFARKPGADLRPVSVSMIIDEAVMLMLPQAKKLGVELSVVRNSKDFTVMAGHTRLEQVLINLIANGLDAISEHQGQQSDGASKDPLVQIMLWTRDGHGVIEVSDNGPGIDPKVRAEIFEPFVTSKGHGVGLGLGLPIAYNLVKGFGGELRCVEPAFKSMVTAFEVVLPLANDTKDHEAVGRK